MNRFTGWFGEGQWFLLDQNAESLTYGRSYFHTWQIVVAILGFPIGLLGLLAEKRHARVTADFACEGDDAMGMTLTGAVPTGVADQLADRIDAFDPGSSAAAT